MERGGCPPEAWAKTLSRLLPPEGTPTEEELEAEVEEMVSRLMMDDPEEEDEESVEDY